MCFPFSLQWTIIFQVFYREKNDLSYFSEMWSLQLCELNFVIHRNIHMWWIRKMKRDFLKSIHCKMNEREGKYYVCVVGVVALKSLKIVLSAYRKMKKHLFKEIWGRTVRICGTWAMIYSFPSYTPA